MKTLRETKYLKTEADARKLGESEAEVSFIGRSNVGKSTLINTLCQKKKMAHVSQVPGKTRTINVYEVRCGRWIVDLPGYGYAIGSKREKEQLGPIIEGYLKSRERLRMIFVIVDAVAGPTKLDIIMIDWLKHYSLPFSIIVNKIDKIGSLRLDQRKKDIAAELVVDICDISWLSSKKNIGITDLQKIVTKLLDI
ncbi:ribosome biogenesis GTP-binding protein YihA/YsxC [Candidatus Omnitrophota bacterium]